MIHKGEYILVDDRIAWHEFLAVGKCHDCGKPSRSYRCEKCECIFKAKHMDYDGMCMVEGDLPSLHNIFRGINRDRMFKGSKK